MTCTHKAYFPQPTIFLKFLCLCGGGGMLHCYHHFPEVKFLCVGGGGQHFYYSKRGGGTILSRMLNVFRDSIFSHLLVVR